MTWPPQSLLESNPVLFGLLVVAMNPAAAMASAIVAAFYCSGKGGIG